MRKYFCDVCGAELSCGGKTLTASPEDELELCGLKDLCPRREGFVRELDVSALVLSELRRLVKAPQESPASPVQPPSPKGKAAREKREILAAVNAYRQEHGPGSISKLAKQAKVGEGDLRDMISCTPVPIATWRKVGKALAASGIAGNGGNDGTADLRKKSAPVGPREISH